MTVSKRLVRNYRQTLDGGKDEIFSLLCPVREKEWLNGWDYKMVYSESGLAEKGCIFETDNDFGTYQWVMTQYNREDYVVQFVKFIQGHMIVIIDINLIDAEESRVYCDITYTFTVMDDQTAETMHKDNTESVFNGHMKLWEESMNYYLSTGQMLK